MSRAQQQRPMSGRSSSGPRRPMSARTAGASPGGGGGGGGGGSRILKPASNPVHLRLQGGFLLECADASVLSPKTNWFIDSAGGVGEGGGGARSSLMSRASKANTPSSSWRGGTSNSPHEMATDPSSRGGRSRPPQRPMSGRIGSGSGASPLLMRSQARPSTARARMSFGNMSALSAGAGDGEGEGGASVTRRPMSARQLTNSSLGGEHESVGGESPFPPTPRRRMMQSPRGGTQSPTAMSPRVPMSPKVHDLNQSVMSDHDAPSSPYPEHSSSRRGPFGKALVKSLGRNSHLMQEPSPSMSDVSFSLEPARDETDNKLLWTELNARLDDGRITVVSPRSLVSSLEGKERSLTGLVLDKDETVETPMCVRKWSDRGALRVRGEDTSKRPRTIKEGGQGGGMGMVLLGVKASDKVVTSGLPKGEAQVPEWRRRGTESWNPSWRQRKSGEGDEDDDGGGEGGKEAKNAAPKKRQEEEKKKKEEEERRKSMVLSIETSAILDQDLAEMEEAMGLSELNKTKAMMEAMRAQAEELDAEKTRLRAELEDEMKRDAELDLNVMQGQVGNISERLSLLNEEVLAAQAGVTTLQRNSQVKVDKMVEQLEESGAGALADESDMQELMLQLLRENNILEKDFHENWTADEGGNESLGNRSSRFRPMSRSSRASSGNSIDASLSAWVGDMGSQPSGTPLAVKGVPASSVVAVRRASSRASATFDMGNPNFSPAFDGRRKSFDGIDAFAQPPPMPLLRRNSTKMKTFDGLGANNSPRSLMSSPEMSPSTNLGSLAVKGNAVAPSPTLGGMPSEYLRSPAIGGSFKSPGMSKLLKSPNMSASFDLGRPSPMQRPTDSMSGGNASSPPAPLRRRGTGAGVNDPKAVSPQTDEGFSPMLRRRNQVEVKISPELRRRDTFQGKPCSTLPEFKDEPKEYSAAIRKEEEYTTAIEKVKASSRDQLEHDSPMLRPRLNSLRDKQEDDQEDNGASPMLRPRLTSLRDKQEDEQEDNGASPMLRPRLTSLRDKREDSDALPVMRQRLTSIEMEERDKFEIDDDPWSHTSSLWGGAAGNSQANSHTSPVGSIKSKKTFMNLTADNESAEDGSPLLSRKARVQDDSPKNLLLDDFDSRGAIFEVSAVSKKGAKDQKGSFSPMIGARRGSFSPMISARRGSFSPMVVARRGSLSPETMSGAPSPLNGARKPPLPGGQGGRTPVMSSRSNSVSASPVSGLNRSSPRPPPQEKKHHITKERALELLQAAKFSKGIVKTDGMSNEDLMALRKQQLVDAVKMAAADVKEHLNSPEEERERLETKIPQLLETRKRFLAVRDHEGVETTELLLGRNYREMAQAGMKQARIDELCGDLETSKSHLLRAYEDSRNSLQPTTKQKQTGLDPLRDPRFQKSMAVSTEIASSTVRVRLQTARKHVEAQQYLAAHIELRASLVMCSEREVINGKKEVGQVLQELDRLGNDVTAQANRCLSYGNQRLTVRDFTSVEESLVLADSLFEDSMTIRGIDLQHERHVSVTPVVNSTTGVISWEETVVEGLAKDRQWVKLATKVSNILLNSAMQSVRQGDVSIAMTLLKTQQRVCDKSKYPIPNDLVAAEIDKINHDTEASRAISECTEEALKGMPNTKEAAKVLMTSVFDACNKADGTRKRLDLLRHEDAMGKVKKSASIGVAAASKDAAKKSAVLGSFKSLQKAVGKLTMAKNLSKLLGKRDGPMEFWRQRWMGCVSSVLDCLQTAGLECITAHEHDNVKTVFEVTKELINFASVAEPDEERNMKMHVEVLLEMMSDVEGGNYIHEYEQVMSRVRGIASKGKDMDVVEKLLKEAETTYMTGRKAQQAKEAAKEKTKERLSDKIQMPPEWRVFDLQCRNFKLLKVASIVSRWSKVAGLLLYKGNMNWGGLTSMLDTIRVQRAAEQSGGAVSDARLSKMADDEGD